jgi:hypothetical protein
MANTITVTMYNDTTEQQVFFATDNVMQAPAPIEGTPFPGGYPLPAGQTVHVSLVVNQYNHGDATGGFGGNMNTRNSLNDGDALYP